MTDLDDFLRRLNSGTRPSRLTQERVNAAEQAEAGRNWWQNFRADIQREEQEATGPSIPKPMRLGPGTETRAIVEAYRAAQTAQGTATAEDVKWDNLTRGVPPAVRAETGTLATVSSDALQRASAVASVRQAGAVFAQTFGQPGGPAEQLAGMVSQFSVRPHAVFGERVGGGKDVPMSFALKGLETLSAGQVQRSVTGVQGAIMSAAGTRGGAEPRVLAADLIETVSQKMTKWADDQKAAIKDMKYDPQHTRDLVAGVQKEAAFRRSLFSGAVSQYQGQAGMGGIQDIRFTAETLRGGPQELREIATTDAAVNAQIVARGGGDFGAGIRDITQQGGVLGGEGGAAYRVWGSQGGRGRGGRGGGFWGGGAGQAMYGMYMMKRLWSFTGAIGTRAMGQYGQMYGAAAPAAMYGQQGEWDLTGTAGGMQGIGQQVTGWLGQGMYEQFGGLYGAAQSLIGSPMAGRAAATGLVAAGAITAGSAAAAAGTSLLGAAGIGMGAAIGAVAPPIALAALALWGGGELIRAAPEVAPRTLQYGGPTGLFGGDPFGAITQEVPLTPEQKAQVNTDALIASGNALVASTGYSKLGDVMPSLYAAQMMFGSTISEGGAPVQWEQLDTSLKIARERGVDPAGAMQQGGLFAQYSGYAIGTKMYYNAAVRYQAMSPAEQTATMDRLQVNVGYEKMFGQIATKEEVPEQHRRWLLAMHKTGAQKQRSFAYESALRSYGMEGTAVAWQAYVLSEQPPDVAAAQLALAGVAGRYGDAEMVEQAVVQTMGMGMDQLRPMAMAAQGDMGAMSHLAGQGLMPPAFQFFGDTGRPIYETDWQGFMGMGKGQAAIGNLGAQRYFGADMDTRGFFSQQGIDITEAQIGSLEAGGTRQLTKDFRSQMYGLQMAGIGVQSQGIAARQQYLMGGGTWDKPGAGSMWALQDIQRGLGQQATMAGFAGARQRLDVGRGFAQEREALTGERMELGHDRQRYARGFARTGQLMGRQWQREDWDFQDTMRGLQFGWGMEDISEGIRMTSGRQRRTLVRQRERMTLSHNLEDQQIDKGRDRQEVVWAREDERHEKTVEYQDELMSLDTRQFEMSVAQRETLYTMDSADMERRLAEYLEMQEIQEQIIKAQREFQAEEIERSKRALGIQAAMLQAQKDHNEVIEGTIEGYESAVDFAAQMIKYGPGLMTVLASMLTFVREVSNTNAYKTGIYWE